MPMIMKPAAISSYMKEPETCSGMRRFESKQGARTSWMLLVAYRKKARLCLQPSKPFAIGAHNGPILKQTSFQLSPAMMMIGLAGEGLTCKYQEFFANVFILRRCLFSSWGLDGHA
jgi:hypothetical protein